MSSYSVSAYAPGTAVHGALLHAASLGFYTGLQGPQASCPLPASECPPVVGTLVRGDMDSMSVVVPGGQSIYVPADGQVKYIMPHSGFTPPGSLLGCFIKKTVRSQTSDCITPMELEVDDFNDGNGHIGLALCPDLPKEMVGTEASFVLYAKTADFNLTDCTDLEGLTLTPSEATVGAFQYW
ncbi:hypothetical protein F5Y17DRAFT_445701 [Xylariaceae sp. FL0594]|nr:hypothetical protein F5Y17DRAFT_445701 [Xylariaceae sp. FL0594]